MSAPSTRLRLDQSTLIFFPTQAPALTDVSYVVQVMIKALKPTQDEVALFYNAQEEISRAVERLVFDNLVKPVQKKVEIEGEGFVLTGEKMEWDYGKRLQLKWGDEQVRAAKEKWVFYFKPRTLDALANN